MQAQTRDGRSLRILTLIAALADSLCLQASQSTSVVTMARK